ncbi:MAG: hypothetical protein V3R77_02260 [Candidatus Binatia bacterium]
MNIVESFAAHAAAFEETGIHEHGSRLCRTGTDDAVNTFDRRFATRIVDASRLPGGERLSSPRI